MGGTQDWYDWHGPYADPASPLSRRLALVRQHVGQWLDERTDDRLRVVSVCAGQGRDLLDVLAHRPDAGRVEAYLLESDPRNVAAARTAATAAGLTGITVLPADAGDLASYRGLVPADLVVLAGVLGNITDADVRLTIETLPRLCAAGATVIWTRTREAPDLTPTVRGWFAAAGFVESAFHAPPDVLFSVGVHRFAGEPQPLVPAGKMFRFVR